MSDIGNRTVPVDTILIRRVSMETKLQGLKGYVQRAINDMALMDEALHEAIKCTSIATSMFYMAAAERYVEKIKEDITQFVVAAKEKDIF
jgi:hypothetical protein